LYGFIGSVPVWAQLRSSDIDASKGTVEALEKIVPAIRARCPQARILEKYLVSAFFWARVQACLCGGKGREFVDFTYQTLNSWSRVRRVIGKAEVLPGGDNPRFVVTNIPATGFIADTPERFAPRACYEDFYCARGDMENRIKEQQLDLFADRTSTHPGTSQGSDPTVAAVFDE